MPISITELDEHQQARMIENRWREGDKLWTQIKKVYDRNKGLWKNLPEWLNEVPRKKSKVRDNRVFISTETVINNLTGRPSKPNMIPGNDTPEAKEIVSNLQRYILAKYRNLGMKKKMRRGLRYLFFSRMIVMKVFWNKEIDDFDEKPVNPLNVRFSPDSAEGGWAIEEIETKADKLMEKFSDMKDKIMEKLGYSDEKELYIENPKVKYREAWMDDYVLYWFNGVILKVEPHPYWDWTGLTMQETEVKDFKDTTGARRRALAKRLKGFNETRKKLKKERSDVKYETYLYNHLPMPTPPYIRGTILDEEETPIGETSLIEQADPLQEGVDKRKRQFDDNAQIANGVWKVDTRWCKLSKAEAQKAKADPQGIIYGDGVKLGVTRETGTALPSFLREDLLHSIAEIDNIFGTQPTFRGEKGTQETATGRSILREQSMLRMDELIDLVDEIHLKSYNWWFQMMKVKYTERHYARPLGSTKASEMIDIMQDDFDDGVEVRIIPGQILPEDKLFKAERATEAATAKLIDPLSYFEATGWDEPMEQAKRLEMYKMNPFSILDMTDEDIAKLQEGIKQMQAFQPGGQGGQGGASPEGDKRAAQVAEIRQRIEATVNSKEFKELPPEQQRSTLSEMRNQLAALTQASQQ